MTFSLSIMAREITAAVNLCSQIVDQSGKIPILRATRIDAGQRQIMATNSEQTITVKIACEGEGVICIDTPALLAKVQTLKPDAPVSFVGDGKSVTITQGRTRWTAPCMLDEFPAGQEVAGSAITVGVDFIKALTICNQAADQGGSRPYLEGVYLHGKNVVGTNGRQMRIMEHGDKIKPNVIVSSKAAAKVISVFPHGGQLIVTTARCQISNDSLTMTWRNIDGTYPAYDQVAKGAIKSAKNSCRVKSEDFIETVKRATAIRSSSGKEEGTFVNCRIDFKAGEIEILARNSDGEEGSDILPCDGTGNTGIGVNGIFVIAAAESLECSPIEIAYGDTMDPIILRAVGDDSNIRIVMPRIFK